MSAIKREQAEWLAEFLDVDTETFLAGFELEIPEEDEEEPADGDVGAEAEEDEPAELDTSAEPGQTRAAGFVPVAAGPAIPVAVIIAGAQYLTRELVATVTVTNSTDQPLTLDKGVQLAHGELFGAGPKAALPAGQATTFKARSSSLASIVDNIPLIGPILNTLIGHPSLTGVEGTFRYLVGDTGTSWTCHFTYPRIVGFSKEASGTVAGPNAGGLQDQSPGPPSSETWQFVLTGKGGGGGGGGSGSGPVTCRVTVVNDSDQTIYLRHQDNIGGEFTTNPKTKLDPGQSDNFLYGATAGEKDRACRGKLFYDVGDPKSVEWELMWDNRVSAKNISASFLNPQTAAGNLHSLDQIDNGDENVPVTFTLSGKGGAGPGQGRQYDVTIDNKTDADLVLGSTSVAGGALNPAPPQKLAAGASAKMQFVAASGEKAASLALTWAAGQSGTSWQIKGTMPEGGDPAADGTLAPANPALSSTATAAKSGTGGNFAYALSGKAAPVPETPDDDFAPPPKSKQPTLRKGDDSSDGWVEYAQRLLNKWSAGKGQAKDKVDGAFDGAMEKKVKAFQQDLKCKKVDGVIGNETWSMLRESHVHEEPESDHRQPHTFKEKGPQGRFVTEREDMAGYDVAADSYFIYVVSTGEQPLDDYSVTMKVMQPEGGKAHTHKAKIGKAVSASGDGQGDFHTVEFKPFLRLFGIPSKEVALKCTIDAYLDKEIGGDRLQVPVVQSG